MKKIVGMLWLLVFLLLATAFVNAETTVNMMMDGKQTSFNVVGLKLDGQTIQSDVPSIIHNDRTLVPLRAIMENIDAEVSWDPDNYQVTVVTDKVAMLLKIDSVTATVNGEVVSLPDNVPPKLVNDRTMVPIRFVAEALGLEVGWDQDTRTVLLTTVEEEEEEEAGEEAPPAETQEATVQDVNVALTNGSSEIRVQTSKAVQFKETTLTNPTRLVFDLQNTTLDLKSSRYLLANGSYSQLVDHPSIKEVRVSQFQKDPNVTRVVVEMKQDMGYEASFDSKTNELVIQFKNYVQEVKAETLNLKEVITITGDKVDDYNVMYLENPKRLVVDVKDAYLNSKNGYQFSVNGKVAKSVRVAQFTPDEHYDPNDKIVRIVIDLQEQADSKAVQFEVKDNRLIVHLEGEPFSQLLYQELNWTAAEFILNGQSASQYKINDNQDENMIEVLIPKTEGELEFSSLEINDHMIKNILVDSSDQTNHSVKLYLQEDVEYTSEVITGTATRQLILKLKNTNPYRDILIVIDPGHGAHDPGASSATLGLKEKDIVLDVSLRFNQLLKEAGFRTHMTRSDDVYIELLERAGVANDMGADLFVSVHANAILNNPAVNGVETLYYPNQETRDNKTVAQIFQDELIKQLGAYSRGIIQRPNLVVLRETKMPAVLSEMGFLTNPEEESKLNTEAYRQKVAQALFDAVVKYFNQIK